MDGGRSADALSRSDSSGSGRKLERFPAKWEPVRRKKTRQNNDLERVFDSTESKTALGPVVRQFKGEARSKEPGSGRPDGAGAATMGAPVRQDRGSPAVRRLRFHGRLRGSIATLPARVCDPDCRLVRRPKSVVGDSPGRGQSRPIVVARPIAPNVKPLIS